MAMPGAISPMSMRRSRAYRWGEDGIAGLCDNKQRLCVSLALWNGKDPILKERMFGLSNRQGNHGEDVKELYYYLDATPTYSYAHMLYKYPQAEFPYAHLVEENARRTRQQPEFEIIDTGIFDADRYFDVDIEYAKSTTDDILMQVTVSNRGPDPAEIHVLPQIWFRNTWSWFEEGKKPSLEQLGQNLLVHHPKLGEHIVHFERADEIVFCENETNLPKLYGVKSPHGFYKDGFHEYVVNGNKAAINTVTRGHQGGGHPQAHRGAGRQRGHPGPAQCRPAQGGPFRRFRQHLRAAQGGGGYLLWRNSEEGEGRGSAPDPAPGLRRHALVQAVFLLRRDRMADGRRGRAASRR